MNTETTNALKFADFVQGALRLGVNLATKAFENRDVGFFEAAIAEQGRLVVLAKRNVITRPGFDEWRAAALKADSESFIHAYDTTGEIARLNAILFGEFGRDYYTQFVVPAFNTPIEALEAQFATQVTTLEAMIEVMKTENLTKEDDTVMSEVGVHLNKMLDEASPEELVAVLKK